MIQCYLYCNIDSYFIYSNMDKPKLLDQVRNLIRVKHYSIRTEEAYLKWIKRYILFHHKKHPRDMGEKEISRYLTHLAVNRNVAAATQNQAFNAIIFLYRQVLNIEIGDLWPPRARQTPAASSGSPYPRRSKHGTKEFARNPFPDCGFIIRQRAAAH